jgi:hypothetical protein
MVSSKEDGFALASRLDTQASANDIIHKLESPTIPRISAIANMARCERAAYNISFLGVQSNYLPGAGDIGSAVHRIVIKSTLEIVQSIKNGARVCKSDAMDIFSTNAHQEVDVNWKFYMLSGLEQPLPIIMEDLKMRADRRYHHKLGIVLDLNIPLE